jgi:hypothetical protein
MKTKNYLIIILFFSTQMLFGQQGQGHLFIEDFCARERIFPEHAKEYSDIDGSPYYNSNFVSGFLYLKDSLIFKIPIRYNIYADEMEFNSKGMNYVIGNPATVNKIILGESVFVYLPFIQKGGYFELFELGKCTLVAKISVDVKPAEEAKPMVDPKPAKFIKKPDVFYFVVEDSIVFKIKNIESITDALQDQKLKIESFMKQEKIKSVKKETLIKIVKYYNSL